MAESGSRNGGGANKANRKVANRLVALSSAAVLAVYSAGYLRTKAAAERFERQAAQRRPATPAPAFSGGDPGAVAPGVGEPARLASETPAAVVPQTPVPGGSTVLPGSNPTARVAAPESRPALDAALSAGRATGAEPRSETAARSESVENPIATPVATTATVDPGPTPVEPPPVEVAPAPPARPKGEFVDGTYTGWGYSRHGDIQASVLVEDGRITSATIAQCLTRYSCNWIAPLLPQVAARQRADLDYVSGATESSYAFADAVADALSKAK